MDIRPSFSNFFSDMEVRGELVIRSHSTRKDGRTDGVFVVGRY